MDQLERGALLAAVQAQIEKLDKSRQILPSFMLGAKPGGGAAPGQVLPFPKQSISDQRRMEMMFADQMPRLEKLAADRFRVSETPTLPPGDRPVTPLLRIRDEIPQIKSMLGHEEPRYGASAGPVAKRGPLDLYPPGMYKPENILRGREVPQMVSSRRIDGFATQEEARRAALIEAIQYYSHSSGKPNKPAISEFASPESARKSWRVIEGDPAAAIKFLTGDHVGPTMY